MLNRKIGVNEFVIKGIVSDILSDRLKVKVNELVIDVMVSTPYPNVIVGSYVRVVGNYVYKSRVVSINAHAVTLESGRPDITGHVCGEIHEVKRFGSQESPWAQVLLTTKFNIPNDTNVYSELVLVAMSKGSLEQVQYDLRKHDRIEVQVHNSSFEESLALKVTKVLNHYPIEVIKYFSSERYINDRGL